MRQVNKVNELYKYNYDILSVQMKWKLLIPHTPKYEHPSLSKIPTLPPHILSHQLNSSANNIVNVKVTSQL